MKRFYKILVLFFLVAQSCGYQQNTVDMIVHNAIIYTVDEGFTMAEAMAIDSGKVVAIGAEREIRNKYSAESLVNAEGKPVYPGFIDSHCHFVAYGLNENEVDLSGTKSWEDCVNRIKEFAKTSDSYWIEGAGWDQNDWEVKEFPNNKRLNELFPDRPVLVGRVDLHAFVANDKALALANVDAKPPVTGGYGIVDDDKNITGLLIDNEVNRVKNVIPEPNTDQLRQGILRAQKDCFEQGLTTVDEAGLDTSVVNLIERMHANGELKMRVYAMLEATNAGKEFMKNGMKLTDKLSVRSIKLYGDGALGSRGAALKKDYHDNNGHRGGLIHKPVFYKQWAALCNLYGFQMNTHCIGDRANQIVLSVYQEQLAGTNDKRWRVEHAQVLTGNDLAKFGRFNILPSVQPTHATSDMGWVEERLGEERLEGAYAYASLLEQNGLVLLGTDFPVEEISPIFTFYAGVFRKDRDGNPIGGWKMEDALSKEQALRGMTIWGAIGNFEEEKKGSLEKGKFADFVILDRDIMSISEKDILDTKVVATYLGGEKVY